MMISSGELDRRVVIQNFTTTTTARTNEQVKTYATLYSVWAKRLKAGSNEEQEGNQQVAKREYRYMIRYKSDITEKMRLVDGTDTYDIGGIEVMDRKAGLILSVTKRDNAD
jgi:SPP1 family predicted phage head-tail adaptor